VPPAIFRTWCRNLAIEEVAENSFEVPSRTPFYRDWLEREIRRPLEEAFRQVFGRAPGLAFRISDSAERWRLRASPARAPAPAAPSRRAPPRQPAATWS